MKTLIFFVQHDDPLIFRFLESHLAYFRSQGYDALAWEASNKSDMIEFIRRNIENDECTLRHFYKVVGLNDNKMQTMTISSLQKLNYFIPQSVCALHSVPISSFPELLSYYFCLPGSVAFSKLLFNAHQQHQFQILGVEDTDIHASLTANTFAIEDKSRDEAEAINLIKLRASNKNVICFLGAKHFKGVRDTLMKHDKYWFDHFDMFFLHTKKDASLDMSVSEEDKAYHVPQWFWDPANSSKVASLNIFDVSIESEKEKALRAIQRVLKYDFSNWPYFHERSKKMVTVQKSKEIPYTRPDCSGSVSHPNLPRR